MELNTIACSLLGVFSMAAADAKFILFILLSELLFSEVPGICANNSCALVGLS
jgi:hypothetical protein